MLHDCIIKLRNLTHNKVNVLKSHQLLSQPTEILYYCVLFVGAIFRVV